MATILIDAEVYQVDDDVALHRGVAYESFEAKNGATCNMKDWNILINREV